MITKLSGKTSASRANEEYFKALLDRLDGPIPPLRKNRRINRRYRYRRAGITMRVLRDDGGGVSLTVYSRDLSATGMSVLHNSFMHIGTAVEVTVRGLTDEPVVGVVKRCIHVGGTTHLVGIEFKTRIQPALYVDSDALLHAECSDLRTTQASILVVADEIERKSIQSQLSETALSLIQADNAQAARDIYKQSAPHVILCDLNFSDGNGEDLIREFRTGGYAGPIVACTAEGEANRARDCLLAGADWMVTRPYAPEELHYTLAQAIRLAGGEKQEPLRSLMVNNKRLAQLLPKFVDQVKATIPQMRDAIADQKMDFVKSFCQSLKGCGGAYGFPLLTTMATEALEALDDSMSIPEALPQLRRLEWVVQRLDARRRMSIQ